MQVEPLESRQMLSLTVNVDVAGGGIGSAGTKTATVTSVGQVVDLDVYATVTGTEAVTAANTGFQSLCGSFLSTLTTGGSLSVGSDSVGGNLSTAIPTFEFQANGAVQSTAQDLNGDGYLDSGSNDNADIAGFFNARGGAVETDGTVSGDSETFLIGTLSYTVTNLNYGQATDINFRMRDGIPAGAYDAIWVQNGEGLNDQTGTVITGNSVVITDPKLSVPNTASISGNVEKSVNGTTSAFSGVTVYLDTNDTGSYVSTDPTQVTDSSGDYDFTGLAAGTYYLREVVPTGYKQTSPSSTPTLITVTNKQTVSGQDFIDASTAAVTGSISGAVTKVVSGTSSSFSGVTVYIDTNNDGSLDSGDISTTTSSTGAYSFTGLPAGTYHIREVVPSGYTQTSPGSTPTTVTLTAGQNATGDNFTDTANTVSSTASISGNIFQTVAGQTSDMSGVTVYLDTNDNGSLNTGEPSTVTTTNGGFSFTGLAAGTYYLREVVPTNFKQTSPSSSPTKITLTSAQASTGDNFTNTATYTPGSITGTVYNDKNGDGKLDNGEAGISGVEMYIDLNKDGTIDSGDPTITTSSTGAYSFYNLAPGTYRVREVVPSGDKLTDPAPAVGYFDIIVQSNWQITGENWGNVVPSTGSTGSISGTVYSDANKNGKLDSGEIGIPGVTVYLDLKNDGKDDTGDPVTTTSSTGTYTFAGLAPGNYTVREVLLSGDSFTTASSLVAVVASGKSVTGENFGNYGAITLSGNVFNDVNGNGVKDTGDNGLSGWVVYCDLNNDGKFEANENNKTTDSNGNFEFVSLSAGTYTIRIVPKSGYTLTSPSAGYYTVTIAPGVPVSISFAEHP
jgi:uncharacterized protein (DUF2141 family)